MKNFTKVIALVTLLLFFPITSAHAILSAVSPTPDPANGFPLWYQDAAGIALAPCLDPSPAPCVLLADAFFNPLLPISFPTNFPTEFFYMLADVDSKVLTANPNIKIARFALEGTFANVPTFPLDGMQTVFTRVRIRFTPPVLTASYIVDHPFGSITFNPPYARGVVNYTQDIPAGAALNFTGALNGGIGPFLKWDVGAPAGYIGDAVTPHKVVGSPLGNNFFQITGPDIGGPGINAWRTDFFILSGKISPAVLSTPLTVDRATYARAAGVGTVDVFAHSVSTSFVTVTAGPNFPVGAQPLLGDGLGAFHQTFSLLPNAAQVPGIVTVTAIDALLGGTPTILTARVTDVVTITSAVYDATLNTLTIKAGSSDKSVLPPVLTALGGTLTGGTLVLSGLIVPPNAVTVSSSAGGSATLPVTIIGTLPPPPESLTIKVANFVQSKTQWEVSGTSSANTTPAGAPNVITLHLGTAQGQLIGTATVAGGRWALKLPSSTVIATATNRTVTAVSSLGTVVSGNVALK